MGATLCLHAAINCYPSAYAPYVLAPSFWQSFRILGFCFMSPFAHFYGAELALYELLHAMLLEYFPFIILLFALFTVAGGIRLKGSLVGTPLLNTIILVIGTSLASWMGTTGAAMLLIRPLIRANAHRKYKVHNVIFFIFLVANAGGCLTPLGDPPLFLGFLQGVGFFWTFHKLLIPMIFLCTILLILHFIIDTYFYYKDGKPELPKNDEKPEKLALEGLINFPLLGGVVAVVLMSGMWKPNFYFPIFGGLELALEDVARDVLLILIAMFSLQFTKLETRELNDFNWGPIAEVGKLFFGIFISMIPAIAILKAGVAGALSGVISLVTLPDGAPNNLMYFWLSGILSSFLDNAPTYLVFFNTAGGDAKTLMTTLSGTLLAISAGSVFMGANTYIGNAPNFMVRSIAEDRGIKMPSFFGYMLWSGCILTPCFILMSFLFF